MIPSDGYQSNQTRITVEGHLAHYVPGSGWALGQACNLQITRHGDHWLVHGWAITDKAVQITVEDGRRIAEGLRAA